jgi:hypothetical protein
MRQAGGSASYKPAGAFRLSCRMAKGADFCNGFAESRSILRLGGKP